MYDEDITETPVLDFKSQIENVCYVFTITITLLMIILGLPSIASVYDNPLPTILMFGLAALVMSILYLALIIKNANTPK